MRLVDYLRSHRLTNDQFAEMVGASTAAVRKWRYGERIPRPAIMARIREATNGAVTADDFTPTVEAAE